MKKQEAPFENSDSTKTPGTGALTRRALVRSTLLGTGLLGAASATPAADGLGAQAASSERSAQGRRSRRIIDSHIHLWKLPRNAAPMNDDATWPSGCCGAIPYMEVDRLMPDYDARVGGPKVDQVVLVESSVGTEKLVRGNQWMLETAAADRKILSVVGKMDEGLAPAAFAQQLDMLTKDRKFVGIRLNSIFLPNVPARFSNIKPNAMTNLALLAKRGLMIDSLGPSGKVLAEIANAIPGLAISMNHFNGKASNLDLEDEWVADMQAASTAPGVYMKVSEVITLSSEAAQGKPAALFPPFQPLADSTRYYPVLEFLLRIFGEDRLIFGSNWPTSDRSSVFVDSIDLQIQIMESWLDTKHRETRDKIMFRNALRVYGPQTVPPTPRL